MNEADFAGLGSLFAPGASWHVCGRSPVSAKLPIPEFVAVMKNLAAAPNFGGMTLTIRTVTEQAGRVAVEWESVIRWTDRDDYPNCGIFLLTISGGKITDAREYLDTYWSSYVMLGQDAAA